MKTRTIKFWGFDNRTTDYLSEVVLEKLAELEIEVESFEFAIEVNYIKGKEDEK